MEGYPCIQKVTSTFTPLQEEGTLNGDKSTTTNENFEQPVYEQLMPSSLVAAGPYPHDAGITVTYSNIVTSNVVPETSSSSGTCIIASYSASVCGDNDSILTVPPKQPANHVPAVQNKQQVDQSRDEAVKPSDCNGSSLHTGDPDKSIPGNSCLTKLQTPLNAMVPQNNDKIEMSVQEVSVKEPSKSRETEKPVKSNDDSAISTDTPITEVKLQAVSNKSESDCTDQIELSKMKDIKSADGEKLTDTNHDEDEESSSDTVISDSCPEATDSGHVSSLFRNVVLVQAETIPAEENDSDERSPSEPDMHSESESEIVDPIVASSVADIGREDENENEMLDPVGLLIDETEDNYEIMEGVAVGQMGRTVALDAPIIDPNVVAEEADNDDDEEKQHGKIDTNGKRKESTSLVGKKRTKQKDFESPSSDEDSLDDGSTKATPQKGQMLKRGVGNVEKQQRNSKKKRSKVSNDDPFGSCASSSSEDVPNDIYFGTPDRVFTVSTKLNWQSKKQKGNNYYARAKGTNRYDDDASSDDEEDEEHVRRRAKRAEEIARLKLPAYQQQQLQQLVLKKHPKRDRFYDRSQDIPNDIYFGNVKVPLHILHASSSSSSEEEPWPAGSVKSASSASSYHKKSHHSEHRHQKESVAYTKSSNYRYSRSTSSRAESTSFQGGSTRSVHRMKEYLKMAGFRHMRYQKLWQGCETNQERAEAILRFLQAQGLQGEPTDEKCRELRKEIQLKKEVEVLDTSVIIGSGEGRVTRQRAKKVSETTAVEPGETHPPEQPCLQKGEQTVEVCDASVPSEAVEVEAKCEQQLTPQEEKTPSKECEEHALPAGDSNHSNSPTNV